MKNTLEHLLKRIADAPPFRDNTFHTFSPVITTLLDALPDGINVLEWGPGKNTELFLASPKVRQVASYESDGVWFEKYKAQFAQHADRLDLSLVPFNVQKPVSHDIVHDNYNPLHPYMLDPLARFGEGHFDIAFVDGAGYRTDCAEIARLLVKKNGFIIWHDILSCRENNPEFPSGRTYQQVFSRFHNYQYYDRHRTLLIINNDDKDVLALTSAKRRALEQTFAALIESDIRYVVLRNFGDIPLRCSLENDIDILIHKDDFTRAHTAFLQLGFTHTQDGTSGTAMLYGASPHNHYKIASLDIHIDVVNGLYYTSPNNNEKVAINRTLQNLIFERKRLTNDIWHYIPHPNDLFLHIFCHAVFDKGEISDEYGTALEELLDIVDNSTIAHELESIVFSFSKVALDTIKKKATKMLPELYLRFSEY